MKCLPQLLFFLSLIALRTVSSGQSVLRISEIKIAERENALKIGLLASKSGSLESPLQPEDLLITEKVAGNDARQVQILKIDTALQQQRRTLDRDTFQVLFLYDVSKHSPESSLTLTRALGEKIAGNLAKFPNCHCYVNTFQGELYAQAAKEQPCSTMQIKPLTSGEGGAFLFEALVESLRFLYNKPGKKAIFLFSSAKAEIAFNNFGRIPFTEPDVLRLVQAYSGDLALFYYPMNKEPKTPFSASLSPYISSLSHNSSQEKIGLPFTEEVSTVRTHIVTIVPSDPVFIGHRRSYSVAWAKKPSLIDSITVNNLGSLAAPILLVSQPADNWMIYAILGVAILALSLSIFAFAIPALKKLNFRWDYVERYKPESGIRRFDPLTEELIQEGEWVVTRCPQITTWKTWKDVGWQCPNYPDCLQMPYFHCQGEGAPQINEDFFALQGNLNRRLNWLWFGMTGGFAGWLLFALFKQYGFDLYKNWLSGISSRLSDNWKYTGLDINNLSNTALLGMCLGMGTIFFLSLVEERGQSRKLSIGRILIRIIIGSFLSVLAFITGLCLQVFGLVHNIYVGSFISWLLFGILLGLTLSIASTIQLLRGFVGGIMAGIIAFIAYLLVLNYWYDYDLAKVLSMMAMGSILGVVLYTVNNSLEEFELEIIAPIPYRRKTPISKWLRSGLEVAVGAAAGSYVYIKWPDKAVKSRHAKLHLEKGKPHITPYFETLLNGRILSLEKSTALKNGDIIQLGRDSITQLRFLGKGKNT